MLKKARLLAIVAGLTLAAMVLFPGPVVRAAIGTFFADCEGWSANLENPTGNILTRTWQVYLDNNLVDSGVVTLEPGQAVTISGDWGEIDLGYGSHEAVLKIVEQPNDTWSETFGGCNVPAIDIEKATNGEDADEPTGPEILVGDPVEWEYVVTNTGDVDLTDVTVTDDQLGAICGVSFLAVGDSFTCTVSGVAEAGQYANLGTVVGHYGDVEVNDSDPSHYLGVIPPAPAIDIEKATNGEDADEPTGPEILVGDPVEWEYVVTNTGDVDLTDVTVTDDQLGAICGVSFLAVGDSFTCTVSGVAEAGQYANLGTVVGHYGDVEVNDSDPSHYFGVEPEPPCIGLTKTIDGPYRTADDLFLTDRIIPIAVQRDIDPPGTPNTENLFYFLVEITVENCGGADLTGVVVTDGFSNEAQPFETDDPSSVVIVPPPDPNNGMVHESLTWTVGTIPVGESRTLLVKVGTEFNPSGRLEPTSAPQTIYYNGQDEQTGSASVTADGGLSASVGAMAISNGPEITCVGSMGEWDQLDAQSGPHIHPHDKCAGITTPLPITLSASYPMSDDGTQSPAQFRVFLPLLTAGMETPVGQAQTGYVFPSPWGIVQTVVQDWLR